MTQSVTQKSLPLSGVTALEAGTVYSSPSGKHHLALESDGRLVLRSSSDEVVWSVGPMNGVRGPITTVLLQPDGNLVAHDKDEQWVWSALDHDPEGGSTVTVTDAGALHLVGPTHVVRWSSTGLAWPGRRTVPGTSVTIYGSPKATSGALDAVVNVYTEMVRRFSSDYPTSKLENYVVYLTNGDTWADLKDMGPITTEFGDKTDSGTSSGDFIRGGTSEHFLWIEEEMICKTGVKTRNDGVEAGKWEEKDTNVRTFDQVVHEFAHAIEDRFGLGSRVAELWGDEAKTHCVLQWAVQGWFGCPTSALNDVTATQRALVAEIFGSEVFSDKHQFEDKTGKVVDKA